MRKIVLVILFFFVADIIIPSPQIQTIKNKAIMQAREMGDTLIARLNNKLYYTLKTDGKWPVVYGVVAFHPFKLTDTTPDIMLTYVTDKAALVKRLRNGDTIRNYFMADMRLSFNDFTDVRVNVTEPTTAYIPIKG